LHAGWLLASCASQSKAGRRNPEENILIDVLVMKLVRECRIKILKCRPAAENESEKNV
jgi:hypothetical protein